MVRTATKDFTVEENSTDDMWYRITVYDHRGNVVDMFHTPTMHEAQLNFEHAGYNLEAHFARRNKSTSVAW
jgi:hypothetical protein